jgi:hypothetical protein
VRSDLTMGIGQIPCLETGVLSLARIRRTVRCRGFFVASAGEQGFRALGLTGVVSHRPFSRHRTTLVPHAPQTPRSGLKPLVAAF